MLRSILSNWAGLLIGGVTSIVMTAILVHHLGDFYFGMWALASSLFGYCGFLDMGMRTTVQRFVARFKGLNEREATNQTLANALAITLGIALVACMVSAALTVILPGFFGLDAASRAVFRWVIALLGIEVAVAFPARLLGTYLIGLQRFDLYNLVVSVGTTTRAGFQLAALHLGFGIVGIAAVNLAVELVFLPIQWRLLRRADRGLALRAADVSWTQIRGLVNFGVYAFLGNVGDYLRFYAASMVIGRVLSVSLLTPFTIASRLMSYFRLVMVGLTSPFLPRMSELEGQSRREDLREMFLGSAKISLVFSLFIGSLVVLDGKALLSVWVGNSFVRSYNVLLILTAGYTAALSQWPSSMVIYATARHRPLGWWTLAEGCANVLLSVYWARRYGLIGVALGTAVPMLAIALIVQPWYVLRLLKIPGREYLLRVVARPALSAVAFLTVATAMHGEPSTTIWRLGVTVGWQAILFLALTAAIGINAMDRAAVTRQFGILTRRLREARLTKTAHPAVGESEELIAARREE